ncbi:restriction endonuclease subunit S [Clostridium perfringens]|uniref:restriction endonuclease subunit S n=1 Tax=Clostridium perfringens TaxID=1502 RepID=UPI0018E4B6B5|nr:restriction endonuclease subunit S [Clostridium perfringens]MBI6107134.1 restriction endonuclease subunit S [Clostridium perfringens]MDM0883229.1 restriction endonuclease subunit S [Clostridium perfringens]HAT4332813.1 restriction endonuclease [Clostridium perfringens]
MEFIKVKDICDIKTGKYDANHSKEDGKYKFFTCALLPMKADTYSFDGKLVMLPGNGANLGEVMYYEGKIEAYQRTYVLHNINIEAKFLYYFLKLNWKKYILRRQIGSATNYMKLEDILNFEVPNISLDMQKKIIDILDGAQRLIDKRKKQIEELDLLVKSKFIEMFGDPVKNPLEWQKGKIADIIVKTQYGTSNKADEFNGDFKVLRMNNITYDGNWDFTSIKYINLDEKEQKKYLVYKGEVLFNRTNSKELVGKTAVYKEDEPMAYAGYLVKAIPNERANGEFISAYMNTKYVKDKLLNMAKNIVGMANINAEEFKKIDVYIPPIELQNQFADFVKQVDKLKFEMEKSLKELENNFNSLMNKAFKGELF